MIAFAFGKVRAFNLIEEGFNPASAPISFQFLEEPFEELK
jgi:hypothetical protein